METYGLVPLRAGSKGIPEKNVKELCGKPLFAWTIDQMIKSNRFKKITVSTESDKYKDLVTDYYGDKVSVLKRPDNLAKDSASLESVMLNYIHQDNLTVKDILLTVQVTSPLVKHHDYQGGLDSFINGFYDSMLTGVKSHRFYWTHEGAPLNYDYMKRPRRHGWDGTIVENGAFYITTVGNFFRFNNRLGGKIGIHLMHQDTFREIDDEADWAEIVGIIRRNNHKK